MGFNTLPFIFIFLPVFLAVYYLMPERLRNGVLALGSLVFYLLGTWKRPWCLALLMGLMALTWLSGRKLAGSKPLLVGNLLVLGLNFPEVSAVAFPSLQMAIISSFCFSGN